MKPKDALELAVVTDLSETSLKAAIDLLIGGDKYEIINPEYYGYPFLSGQLTVSFWSAGYALKMMASAKMFNVVVDRYLSNGEWYYTTIKGTVWSPGTWKL